MIRKYSPSCWLFGKYEESKWAFLTLNSASPMMVSKTYTGLQWETCTVSTCKQVEIQRAIPLKQIAHQSHAQSWALTKMCDMGNDCLQWSSLCTQIAPPCSCLGQPHPFSLIMPFPFLYHELLSKETETYLHECRNNDSLKCYFPNQICFSTD